jgi:alpha-glucoside transport system permease protein
MAEAVAGGPHAGDPDGATSGTGEVADTGEPAEPVGTGEPAEPAGTSESAGIGEVAGTRVPAGLLGETVVRDDVGPPSRDRTYPTAHTSALLVLPAAVLLGALVVWPVVRVVHASVTGPGGGFVGAEHFREALDAEGVGSVLVRTVVWAVVVPTVVTGLGLVFATGFRGDPGRRPARWALVAPIALPLVVTGVAFRLLYDPDPRRGLATGALRAVVGWLGGDPDAAPVWLGPELITLALMSAFVWAWVGLAVVVFRTALAQIPTDLVDVVRASGGGRLQVVRDAYWNPLLRRTVAIVFALVTLATARTFDLVLVMAPDSVVDESSVLAVLQWQTSGDTTTGRGAALGVVWMAAVTLVVIAAAWGSRQAWPPPQPRGGWAPPAPRGAGPASAPATTVAGPGRVLRTLRSVRRRLPSVAAAVWLVPVLVVLATSVQAPRDAATDGWRIAALSARSYGEVVAPGGLARGLPLTAVLALAVTVVVVAVALLAAYALAWTSPPGAHVASLLLLATAVVPVQVIAGPVTEVLDRLQLTDTVAGLWLVHVVLGVPFAVLLLRNALGDLPAGTIREARLTGAGEWRTLVNLAPRVRDAVAAVFVLEFVQVYNDFAVGLLFGGLEVEPLGLLVYGQTRYFAANSGPLAAGAVMASILPLALVVAARRKIVDGLVSGAIR